MIKYFIPRTDPVDESGKIDAKAMEAIRGGWYLGEQGFKDKLLELMDKAGTKIRDRGSLAGAAVRAHHETSCGHEPVGEPNCERSKEPKISEEV